MQPSFHWINEPAEWRRDTDGLTVVTDKHTDFWRHTWYGFERFSGHLYATEVEGDFTLQAKICADFTTLYDHAGLKGNNLGTGETQLLEGILTQTRFQHFPAGAFRQNHPAGAGKAAAGGEKEAVSIAFFEPFDVGGNGVVHLFERFYIR